MSDQPDVQQVLVEAIADVGYWRWWASALPHVFQIEFGGARLYIPPSKPGSPPSSIVSLRFAKPTSIAFLQRESAHTDNWPKLLHENKLDPPTLDEDQFFFSRQPEITQLISEATSVEVFHGIDPRDPQLFDSKIQLAFWAQEFGFVISAESMTPLDWRGPINTDDIPGMIEEWWAYWGKYWDSKNTPTPFPTDYACEITIPLREIE